MGWLARKKRGGDFLVEALRALGIRHVFSVPGMQMLSVWDALPGSAIELVVARTEQDAVFLAEGYACAASRPAVVMNTLGPGVANELFAMESARLSKAPVLFVTPSHPRDKYESGRLGAVFQGFDQQEFLAGSAKRTEVVRKARELARKLERAYAECVSAPRGPVRVEISFPLLFERHSFGAPPTPVGEFGESTEPLFVRETRPNRAPPDASPDVRREIGRVLSPGCGSPGHGVPFALGARLAQDAAPTIAFTSATSLIDNAASL
jgi:acetolactate synthase-1/2/3 large subunit